MNESLPIGWEPTDPPNCPPFWHFWLLLTLAALAAAALILPNFTRCHCPGQLTACKSNCKNLATALEMYASDNRGRYPQRLEQIMAGNYLKLIPTCPAAGRDTYSQSYAVRTKPDSFSFYCEGKNHAKAYTGFAADSRNYPQYDAEQGLLDHP